MPRLPFAAIGRLLALLMIVCFAGPGPAPSRADGMPMMLADSPQPLVAETANGPKRFSIEIADSPEKRERGLMFRQSMGDDHGMLFVFPDTGPRAFWMKNTPMPLDLIFIGEDGRVRALMHGEPFSTDTISPGVPVRFVLELKAGSAQKAGIAVGDRLRHPQIDRVAGEN